MLRSQGTVAVRRDRRSGVRDVGPVGVDARVALGEGDARARQESENREHHTNRPAHRTPRLDATLQLRSKAQAARQGGTMGRDLLMSLRTTALTRAEDSAPWRRGQ